MLEIVAENKNSHINLKFSSMKRQNENWVTKWKMTSYTIENRHVFDKFS